MHSNRMLSNRASLATLCAARVRQAEWMAKQIPDAELVVFEGMRHDLMREQPQRAADLVHEFVVAHEQP